MFAVQSDVMLVIFEPDTPGGLRLSMDWRYPSSSATADDIAIRGRVVLLMGEKFEVATTRLLSKMRAGM